MKTLCSSGSVPNRNFKGLEVFTRAERLQKFTPEVDDWKSHQTQNCWTVCAIYKQPPPPLNIQNEGECTEDEEGADKVDGSSRVGH